MAKKTKGVQISEKLHTALKLQKLDVGLRKKKPDVTFGEVLEDVLDRVYAYEHILAEMIESDPNLRARIAETTKKLGWHKEDYIKQLLG